MAFNLPRSLDADDIFISYTRLDASTYAAGLADELTKRGFSCFIDKLGTDPDAELPDSLKRKIRGCSMLVVVGTRRAATRHTIKEEVAEFVAAGRTSVVPIDFGDTVYGADWYKPIEGIAPEPELNPNALDDGNPSTSVVSRIEKQFNYRRRDERLRRITRRAIAVLVLLVIAIAIAAGVAWQQLARAADATKRADAETRRATDATREAQAAQEAARVAKDEADAARVEADKQRDDATRQKSIADDATRTATEKTRLANEATGRAKQAEGRAEVAQKRADKEQARAERQAAIADIRAGANRSQSYLRQRPEDVPGSLSIALDALKLAEHIGLRNADADAALRESLALLPLRRSSVTLESPAGLGSLPEIAFSPDGLHYATAYSGTLHVYATGDKDADHANAVLERPCECGAVALASGLKRAAATLSDGRGFVILDLKGDSHDRFIAPLKGARGEPIASSERLALSPDGRYLALYAREGEDVGQHSKLLVLDTESGEPVRIFDDDADDAGSAKDTALGPAGGLNMNISDISFGPTGDLAIVGMRPGINKSRAVIWHLHADAPDGAAPTKLTPDSFKDYEVVPLDKDVSAIAPGADATYFATSTGVWKRPEWQTRFDPVARIPLPENSSYSPITRMAFLGGGKSIVLMRTSVPRLPDGRLDFENTKEFVEVWDAAGHVSQAEAFHTANVQRVGFEPGGRLVATTTEDASKDINDGPAGENGARRLRVYRTETGAEVKSAEPTSEDSGDFYVGPDAAQIATLSGTTVKVWDVWAKRERAASFDGALDSLESVALSPGGRFLALEGPGGGGKRVVIYRPDGDAYVEVKRFAVVPGEVVWYGGLLLSADGRRLVLLTYADKYSLHVYDDGAENLALRKPLGDLIDLPMLALSADGRYLAVSDARDLASDLRDTGRARLFDLSKGTLETLLDDEAVTSLAFSPDGRYVGLGTEEGVLHIFETARSGDDGGARGEARGLKEEIARLQHAGSVTAVAFSDDGRYVATASDQNHAYRVGEEESYPLRVWLLRPSELIKESERRLGQLKSPVR